MYDDTLKKRGQGRGVRRSSNLKLTVILCAFAMILSAVAIIPAGESDADAITVSTWDELKNAVKSGDNVYIKLIGNIDVDPDEDDIEIEGSEGYYPPLTIHIDLNGFEIDRNFWDKDDGERLFDITYAAVYISNGRLAGGHAGDGGCIRLDKAYLELNNVNVAKNYAEGDGGAIYAKESEIKVNGGQFAYNTCESDGGAIHLDVSYLTMVGATLFANYAVDDGGALYSNEGYYDIRDCDFSENYCDDDGGAIFVEDMMDDYSSTTIPSIINTKFTENIAEGGNGGAICVNGSSILDLVNVEFTGNLCDDNGGGLAVIHDDNKVRIQGKIVFNNNHDDNLANVYLDEDQVLECGELDEGSSIGIVIDDGDGKFTKGFSTHNPNLDPAKIFHSDDSKYYVALDPDSGEAKLYKEGTGGDMSDNSNVIWIVVGVVIAIIALAAVAFYVLKVRKPKSV
jgi:predicted outer membrane repeat protein